MIFLTILKFFNPKEWLFIAIFAALTYGGFWIYRHGEQHIEAQDAKIEAKQDKQVAAVETAAQSTESQNAIIYEKAVAIPAVGDIGVECVRKSPTVSLPATDAGKRTAANASADSTVGPAYDPTGAALTRARQADDQIKYLQARIRELESEMSGAP